MGLPYENSTSGKNALGEIQKILRTFGCDKFATGEDFQTGEIFVQFEHRARRVQFKASGKGYAVAWLNAHPWNWKMKRTKEQHESHALEIGSIAICSILRDWVKGQVTAIEIGMFSFEGAFLSHLLLPNGMSVIEHVHSQKLLEPPRDAALRDAKGKRDDGPAETDLGEARTASSVQRGVANEGEAA